jgi:glutamine amidotransferase
MIALIDYNVGNLSSVKNALDKLGKEERLVSDPNEVKKYDALILPGVGAFGDAMNSLRKSGLDEAIIEFAKSGKPILGICLGMQLLLSSSEEFGTHEGLGLIEGKVKKFDKQSMNEKLKIPHMGWNRLYQHKNSPLFSGLEESFYLYFVHSFHAVCDEKYVIGSSNYGYRFVSAINKDNIFGIQPHPEKSHKNGLKILNNFIKLSH